MKLRKDEVLNLSSIEHSILALKLAGNEADAEQVIEEYIKAKKAINEAIERILNDDVHS